jgi:eukaryotic-like serine/threonine-protein kinase
MHDFDVPGYVLDRLLGFGATGEVWLAYPAGGGEPIALKRLRTRADTAATEEARRRLQREALVLTEIDDPHIVRLHRVVPASTGEDVLVLDLAPGGSLARLLSVRGRMTTGEVVTIAVPLAQSLAGTHRRGIMHGDISPANVLFAADGRPMLADLGVSRLMGEPGGVAEGTTGFTDPAVLADEPLRPASDVYSLAAVCWAALAGAAPNPSVCTMSTAARAEALCASAPGTPQKLADVVARGLSPDPAARPDAAEFSHLVWASSAAQPIRLLTAEAANVGVHDSGAALTHRMRPPRPTPSVEPARRRRRFWHRPVIGRRMAARSLALVAVPLLLASAVWAGTHWADSTDARDSNVRAPVPAERANDVADWSAVLATLDERWSTAFTTKDLDGLRSVDAPGSPALAGDSALLQRYVDAGIRATGLRLERLSVTATTVSPQRVVLDVVDRIAPYDLVDDSGVVIRTDPGRPEATWRITLVPADAATDEWRILSVARS